MTTIAWDGKILAGDRQTSMFNGDATKVHRLPNGDLFGACGHLEDAHAVMAWINNGQDDDKKPKVEDGFHAIIIRNGKLHAFEKKLVMIPYQRPFFAVGSGRDFAMAAMLLGKTAVDSIVIASQLDVDTGNSVDALQSLAAGDDK